MSSAELPNTRDRGFKNGRRKVQIPSWWGGAEDSSRWKLEKGARIEVRGERPSDRV